MTAGLEYVERAAAAGPEGLLVLHHGRGSDEQDLIGLADLLDPERRLRVVSVRAPLRLPGSPGFHWYVVPRVGYPDAATFEAADVALGSTHDQLWSETGVDPPRTVLGGFSMGTVMSYALGLGQGRPAPAGILAFSGFVPVVDGWEPSLADRQATRAFISHGTRDPVIDVGFARRARDLLSGGGLAVEYHEHDLGHQIDAPALVTAREWLAQTLSLDS